MLFSQGFSVAPFVALRAASLLVASRRRGMVEKLWLTSSWTLEDIWGNERTFLVSTLYDDSVELHCTQDQLNDLKTGHPDIRTQRRFQECFTVTNEVSDFWSCFGPWWTTPPSTG